MTPFLSGEGADYTDIILTGFGQLCFRTSFWDNPFSLYIIFIIIRTGSRTLAQSEVEFCFIIVDGIQLIFFCHKRLYVRSCGFPGSTSV